MLKVPINADIKEYSPKYLIGMGKRQLKALVAGIVISIPFIRLAENIDFLTRVTVSAVIIMGAVLFVSVEPLDMPMEQLLFRIIKRYLMVPRKRIYENELKWEIPEDKEPVKKAKKKKKPGWLARRRHKKEIREFINSR